MTKPKFGLQISTGEDNGQEKTEEVPAQKQIPATVTAQSSKTFGSLNTAGGTGAADL